MTLRKEAIAMGNKPFAGDYCSCGPWPMGEYGDAPQSIPKLEYTGGPTPMHCWLNGCDPGHGQVWVGGYMARTHPIYTNPPGISWIKEQIEAGNMALPWGQIVKQFVGM